MSVQQHPQQLARTLLVGVKMHRAGFVRSLATHLGNQDVRGFHFRDVSLVMAQGNLSRRNVSSSIGGKCPSRQNRLNGETWRRCLEHSRSNIAQLGCTNQASHGSVSTQAWPMYARTHTGGLVPPDRMWNRNEHVPTGTVSVGCRTASRHP